MPIAPPAWPSPNTAEGQAFFSIARLIALTLHGLGWPRPAYLAAVARAGLESSFKPSIPGDDGSAHGLWQWHADRISDIKARCGIDISSAEVGDQCRALDWETSHHPYLGREDIFGCATPRGAGIIFCAMFEGAGADHADIKTGMEAANWDKYGLAHGF